MKKKQAPDGPYISISKLEMAFSFSASGTTHRGTEVKPVIHRETRNQSNRQMR